MKSPLLTLASLLIATLPTHASLIPCATAANPQMCSLCDILVLGNNLTNWAAGILLPLGILAFGIAGVLYLIQKPDQAKSLMAAAAKGIILSLSAFLIVNVTMRALSIPQTDWNTFTCAPQVAQNPSPTDKTTFNTSGEGGPKDSVGNPGDITGDPTGTPESVICNEGRNTSSIPKVFPLPLLLNCSNTQNIKSAIWHFPSDSNFGSQTLDSRQNLRANNTDTITFESPANPDQWNEVTVDVTEMNGKTTTYRYGFGGEEVAGPADSSVIDCDDMLIKTPYAVKIGKKGVNFTASCRNEANIQNYTWSFYGGFHNGYEGSNSHTSYPTLQGKSVTVFLAEGSGKEFYQQHKFALLEVTNKQGLKKVFHYWIGQVDNPAASQQAIRLQKNKPVTCSNSPAKRILDINASPTFNDYFETHISAEGWPTVTFHNVTGPTQRYVGATVPIPIYTPDQILSFKIANAGVFLKNNGFVGMVMTSWDTDFYADMSISPCEGDFTSSSVAKFSNELTDPISHGCDIHCGHAISAPFPDKLYGYDTLYINVKVRASPEQISKWEWFKAKYDRQYSLPSYYFGFN